MNDFEKHFEKLAKTDDASTLWINWLDWVIDQNLIINHDRKLNFRGNEKMYFQLYQDWIKIVSDELEKGDKHYYDYLGVFYEDVIQSKYKAGNRGQFFTPENVCQVMAELCFIGMEAHELEGKLINDCAGGSGRLLLAGKHFAPNGIFILADLDSVACKMAVLNFYIHGVRGAVICKNTLTGEFFEAWRVNNYLGYGLPVPHIELCNSEKDACNIFGISKKNNSVIELDSKSVPADVIANSDDVEEMEINFTPDNGANKKITYKNGQTTLM